MIEVIPPQQQNRLTPLLFHGYNTAHSKKYPAASPGEVDSGYAARRVAAERIIAHCPFAACVY
jgi:hypothetical protein